ncbi:hypothetical protein PPROV_000184200 [Pycnococcus provasolii]|uniref:Uncharacterized protein n=1 Tax=Pycnococcus provasolii TaxID=41880 RepID=A0A830HDD0_9CHLO|nr:hypothetical protein PPROV_000184200 [Pycnococcus provasolii]
MASSLFSFIFINVNKNSHCSSLLIHRGHSYINKSLFSKRLYSSSSSGSSEVTSKHSSLRSLLPSSYAIHTYGCAMNFADADVVRRILDDAGYREHAGVPSALTADAHHAAKRGMPHDVSRSLVDVYLVNTCAIRDSAETRVANHLKHARNAFHHEASRHRVEPPVIAVLGCMAERVKADLLKGDTPLADAVCGPDAYRDLPRLIDVARRRRSGARGDDDGGEHAPNMNVKLSSTETYADFAPVPSSLVMLDDDAHAVRTHLDDGRQGPMRLVSIMRGCANHCTFCVVPKTRGPERSRDSLSILRECYVLSHEGGAREITLLGQNVNSYVRAASDADTSDDCSPQPSLRALNEFLGEVLRQAVDDVQRLRSANHDVDDDDDEREDENDESITAATNGIIGGTYTSAFYSSPGFATRYQPPQSEDAIRFAALLLACSYLCPNTRFRFTSPHPKDFPLELLSVIAGRPNICKQLHLPLQSGNDRVLSHMRRGYSSEAFMQLVRRARAVIGDNVALSTDVISGFSSETEEEHRDTVDVMRKVQFDQAFTFAYSERPGTPAHRRAGNGEVSFVDDVDPSAKQVRLEATIEVFLDGLVKRNTTVEPGRIHLVVVEGPGRDPGQMRGRTDTNRVAVWNSSAVLLDDAGDTADASVLRPGDFVACRVLRAEMRTLFVEPLARINAEGPTEPPRTCAELARMVGAPETFLRRYETGRTPVPGPERLGVKSFIA